MKSLVIGAGFLGKYAIRALLKLNEKNEVTILDKIEPGAMKGHPLLSEFEKDPRMQYMWKSAGDSYDLAKKINEFDNIIMTAAIADVPYAIANPVDTMNVNAMNTTSFMEMLRQQDYKGRLVCMSSESVYGHQPEESLPLSEEKTIPKPVNVYGASKLAQETIVSTYGRSYGLRTVILRSATMFGPYSRLKQAMPIFISQILKGEKITLEGDGSNSRDFIYVTNTVDAIMQVLEKDNSIDREIFNIGSGEETFFKRLIGAMESLFGPLYSSEISYRPWRAGEQGLRVVLDTRKAQEKLGFTPQVRMLDGIKYTASWIAADILHWDEEQYDKMMSIFGFPIGQRFKKVGDAVVRVEEDTNQPEQTQPLGVPRTG